MVLGDVGSTMFHNVEMSDYLIVHDQTKHVIFIVVFVLMATESGACTFVAYSGTNNNRMIS